MATPRAGRPAPVAPVKYVAALLHGGGVDLEGDLYPSLADRFGAVDFAGVDRPFDLTDYYRDEMGAGLSRRIVSFAALAPPEDLAAAKAAAAAEEDRLAANGRRAVNIDVGYLDFHKVVLASYKEGPQKIHLGRGVWADIVLCFRDGAWGPLDWSFPDFRTGRYAEDFGEIRRIYRRQIREAERCGGESGGTTGGGRRGAGRRERS